MSSTRLNTNLRFRFRCVQIFLSTFEAATTTFRVRSADIGSLVSPVWKKQAGVVGGQTLSLDDIENVKLRAPKVRCSLTYSALGS